MDSHLLDFANQVYTALRGVPAHLSDPMFLARFAQYAVDIATAHDDETRRGIAQAAVLKIEQEFGV